MGLVVLEHGLHRFPKIQMRRTDGFILLDLSCMSLGPSQVNSYGSSEGALFA